MVCLEEETDNVNQLNFRMPEPKYQHPVSLIVKPAEAEVFYFHEFLDAVVGTFTTEPRLFDAAKRCNLVRDEAGVNTDHSAFQPLGCSPNATDIATIEVARQTKFGIIGQLNCLLIGFELEQRC